MSNSLSLAPKKVNPTIIRAFNIWCRRLYYNRIYVMHLVACYLSIAHVLINELKDRCASLETKTAL